MVKRFLLLLSAIVWAAPLGAQVKLDAPPTAAAGSTIEITWSLAGKAKDFITIVEKGTPEGRYKAYAYARSKRWRVAVPEQPGEYEIRYLDVAKPYVTLARRPLRVTAVTATLKVQPTVDAGGAFPVHWTGPGNRKDFITIIEAGAPDKRYAKYEYTRKGSPLTLPAPEEPGEYEIRYLTAVKHSTLATAKIRVTSVGATVEAPAGVKAGGKFEVRWTGPNNRRDFITIVKADAEEKSYAKYAYTRKGSPLTLPVPEEPGEYEVRYLTGGQYFTLARTKIRVGGVTATLKAPRQVRAGSTLSIEWTGPDNQGDFITIVKADAEEKSYGNYAYTRKGSPLEIAVPEEPGEYEVRYLSGARHFARARAAVSVTAVSATLEAPEQVRGGEPFEVRWTGPGNRRDFIAIAPAGSPPRTWPEYAYAFRGNPATLSAPLEAGNYELLYYTGREYLILARRPIRVGEPARRPGKLRVVTRIGAEDAAELPAGAAVEVILDASGSMLQRHEGRRRIDIAREVLIELTAKMLPAGTPFALRVFGHRESGSCRTDLETPLGPLDPAAAAARINRIQAKNLAKTPIARSLELVAEDLAAARGARVVVLITDGKETCDGDPAAAIEKLKQGGVDVRVNIVGFAIGADQDLKQSFRYWAQLGGGDYFDAAGAAELGASLKRALRVPYDVVDGRGRVVAGGLVGGEPVELPAGEYSVRTRETPAREIERVTVISDQTETAALAGN